ncbi:hypothetical protein VTK26DRAFT_242 [Humicola hyalothermophila]
MLDLFGNWAKTPALFIFLFHPSQTGKPVFIETEFSQFWPNTSEKVMSCLARLAQSVERETLKELLRHLKVVGSTPTSGSIPVAIFSFSTPEVYASVLSLYSCILFLSVFGMVSVFQLRSAHFHPLVSSSTCRLILLTFVLCARNQLLPWPCRPNPIFLNPVPWPLNIEIRLAPRGVLGRLGRSLQPHGRSHLKKSPRNTCRGSYL